MQNKQLGYYLDVRNADVDLETFALALAVEHVTRLMACGGTSAGRSDPESALLPDDLKLFLARAVTDAQRAGRFVDEWRRLARLVPLITSAWELGHSLFQADLAQALSNRERRKYFTQIDLAADIASRAARKTYKRDKTMQAWLIHGYLRAWRQHCSPRAISPVEETEKIEGTESPANYTQFVCSYQSCRGRTPAEETEIK